MDANNYQIALFTVALMFFVVIDDETVNCRRHRPRKIHDPETRAKLTHRLSDSSGADDGLHNIYSEWSTWSRCSKRCKQARSRRCNSPSECGKNSVKEERTCTGRRCRTKPFSVLQTDGGGPHRVNKKTDIRVLTSLQSFVYSEWSEWSPCSHRCKTRRIRVCEIPLFCNENIIKQDALCYVEGSLCEKLYKKKKSYDKHDLYSKGNETDGKEFKVEVKTLPESFNGSNCGIGPLAGRRPSLRIIGGRETSPGKWPWQIVLLNRYKEPFCGATILSPDWILTAAHCVRKRLRVRAGEHILVKDEGHEQQISVAKSFIHQDYDINTVDNDIAMLKLKRPLKFNAYVQPVCLPSDDVTLEPGTTMTIVGWGKDKHTKLFGTDVLNEANVPIVTKQSCKKVYPDYFISKNMICAGFKRGKTDSCAGDSGGPLLHRNAETKQWYVYGITSFGDGCGRKGKYGIYVKVPNYLLDLMPISFDSNYGSTSSL